MFKQSKNNHEYEFLPAALEVQDSPPSPIGRAVTWSIVTLVIIAVAWACMGQVDIVATAQGKIIPAGKGKIIQPLEIGVVKHIYVQEGQEVKQGDPLIELDATNSGADKARLESELKTAMLEKERLRILSKIDFTKNGIHYQTDAISDIEGVAQDEMLLQKELLKNEISEYQSQLDALINQEKSKQADLAATRNMVAKLEQTLPIVTQRVESLKSLSDKGLQPEQSYLEEEEERISQEQDLAAQRNRLIEISASINAIQSQQHALSSQIKKEAILKVTELNQKVAAYEKELQKTDNRHQLQLLTAPVDGVVNQLEINTIGGVVTPAQALMTIVPKNNQLEVEAWVANKDIGFIGQGQQAEVKVEAFPFTKYGVIDAELLNVSFDAIPDEQLGLIYKTRVALKQSVINVGDKLIDLVPGMNVTVEVKTGKRYLIEYILSPIMEYQDESVRER